MNKQTSILLSMLGEMLDRGQIRYIGKKTSAGVPIDNGTDKMARFAVPGTLGFVVDKKIQSSISIMLPDIAPARSAIQASGLDSILKPSRNTNIRVVPGLEENRLVHTVKCDTAVQALTLIESFIAGGHGPAAPPVRGGV